MQVWVGMIASLVCVRGMSYQGDLQLTHTDGGLFGSVTDGKEAWFGVDGCEYLSFLLLL